MRKIILQNYGSISDVLMLTAVVRDIHLSHPGYLKTDVRTSHRELWLHNPYITRLEEDDPAVEVIECVYPVVEESNTLPVHFIHAFRLFLSSRLDIGIKPYAFKADIHLSEEEKKRPSPVDDFSGVTGLRFWIMISGGKKDCTAKWWDPARCQEVVDHFQDRLLFVQCGDAGDQHQHPALKRVLNVVGQTDLRQLVRLMYHADGVVCPVSMFMHLAAAVETRPGRAKNRPCVVVAGGREPSQWEAYPHHQYLHRNGCLPCCDQGGCWSYRVLPLGDGMVEDEKLCLYPVKSHSGVILPKCLDMITAKMVIKSIENYAKFYSFAWRMVHADEVSVSV